MGASEIRADHPDQEVRLIDELNYKNIEDAYLAGYDSALWRTRMQEITAGLRAALQSAEDQLAAAGAGNIDPAAPGAVANTTGADADMAEFMRLMQEATDGLESFSTAIVRFGEELTEGLDQVDLASMSAAQQNALFIRLARQLKEPSDEVERGGGGLLATVLDTDAQVRAMFQEMADLTGEEVREALQAMRDGSADLAATLSDLDNQVGQVFEGLKLMALMNATLRRSVRPATQGIGSFRTAMSIMRAWATL